MGYTTVARYTASTSTALLALAVGALGLLHVAAGVPTAAIPVGGALVLAYGAVALAPAGRRRVDHVVPVPDTARGNAGLFVAALGGAVALVAGFAGLYTVAAVGAVVTVGALAAAQC